MWRTGRTLGRTLYVQVGDAPSKDDIFLGIMDTAEIAQKMVETINERIEAENPFSFKQEEMDVQLTFQQELQTLINRYSKENASSTPDYILADYLARCLDAYDWAIQQRDQWYGGSRGLSGTSVDKTGIFR